jgi:hypothetical protein
MPTQTTLFGHLASKFSAQPENLATESLNYMLTRSEIAQQAFLRYVDQTTIKLTRNLRFQTQKSGSDSSIPDMVGIDVDGDQVLVVEAKFWAGLTANQPVTYLKRLPANKKSLLLFIAPSRRFQTLWPELVRRCKNDSIIVEETVKIDSNLQVGRIDTNQVLALASWRSVLSFMLRELDTAGESKIVSDILQLQGLCDQMDSDAFLPLHAEELSSNIGRRIVQYYRLVDEVTKKLKAEDLISTKGLRVASSSAYYGQYMKIENFGCFLHFNTELWSEDRETPLWLTVKGPDWEFSEIAKMRLGKLELENPSRLIEDPDNALFIPLFLPVGVEKDEVVQSLSAQVREIAEYLKAPDREN